MATSRAHLASLIHRLEDIAAELTNAAVTAENEGADDVGRDLFEVERALGVAARRLRRLSKALD